ncbi:BglG family transcriptional regulator [Streptococcus pneumoniae]|nr:BglG family transcriptional regulator [Streptococcus pneumoniae]
MVLDKASCDLLQYLMDQETSKTIMAISKDLKESRRKIYYHIDKINAALGDEALHIISIPRIGIHLTEEQRDACCKLLSEVDSYDYIMSAHERMMIMLLWIGISKERITIEKLIELTEVSRNTVLNDLNSIRYQLTLEQYQVTLQVSKSQGYHLHAHPLNKIQYLQSLLYHIFMEENATFVSILEDKMKERLDDECLLSVEMNQFFKEQVPLVEQDLGKKINHHEITFMLQVLPYLLLSCHNVEQYQERHQDIEKEFSLIRKRIEYQVSNVSILEDKMKERLDDECLLSVEMNQFFKEQVPLVEQDLGKKINHHEITFMLQVLPYLLLSCHNVEQYQERHQDIEKEFSLIRKRIEYQVSKKLGERLFQKFEISLSGLEVSLVAVLLLSYRKDLDIHAESDDFRQLKLALEEFIWYFESQIRMEIENKDDLLRNLMIHCKSLLFRKTYGIFSKNPLTKQIRSKYGELFLVTRKSAEILEGAWFIRLTDDDIAYLTIHIGGFLKYTPSSQKNMKKVYLVCDEGVAVSRLLLKQCKLYFPNEQIDTVFTTEQFKSVEDIAQVDVVITTNDDLDSRFPILRVNPILEAEDILKMLDYLKHNIFRNESKSFSENLSSLISSYIVDSKLASKFQEEVQTLINQEIVVQAFLEDI